MTHDDYLKIATAIQDELEHQTDRGLAIVGAAYVEYAIEDCIASRFIKDDDALARIFEHNGPLASFSAKIDIAYLLGFYGPKTKRDLDYIRKVRNDFAHDLHVKNKPEALSFQSQHIADWCRQLDVSNHSLVLIAGRGTVDNRTPRNRFLIAVMTLSGQIELWTNPNAKEKPSLP